MHALRRSSARDLGIALVLAFAAAFGCGESNAGEPPPGGPAGDGALEADDVRVVYGGRIDHTDPKRPRFSAPGAYVKARFRGTGVTVKFDDQFRYGRRNYFDVIVDPGTPSERSVKIRPEPGTSEYVAFSELPSGEHTVVFVKRTESSIGYVDFLGFGFEGVALEAPPVAARRLQIVGDSIACGVGDDVPPADQRPAGLTFEQACVEETWGVPYHDAHKAFGAVSARLLDAEYQIAAVSGIGLTRTYSSRSTDDLRPLPDVYDSLFLEQEGSPRWEPKDFVPDAVLLELGTNDFSPGDDISKHPRLPVDEFVDAYVEFLDELMSDAYYPDAEFFVLGSPMLGDGYPDSTYTFRSDLETAIAEIEARYADRGNVHAVPIHRTIGKGCTSHPSADEQFEIAEDDVVPAVRAVMGW